MLSVVRDDGVGVYLNGQELVRETMPAGPLGFPAWPTGWKGSATENNYTTYTVPAGALVAGDNVVAATVHNASSGSGDLGFDLRLAESADVAPPQPVEVIAAGAD